MQNNELPSAIVGAGPVGLAAAAHVDTPTTLVAVIASRITAWPPPLQGLPA